MKSIENGGDGTQPTQPPATNDAADGGAKTHESELPAPPDIPDVPETIDEYRLVQLIGQGGMGKVFLAEDTALERKVAIKLMTGVTESRRKRLIVEARAAARLQHPNIITVHRVGVNRGVPFIVEEYLRGQGLDSVSKPVSPKRTREIGLALARGLAAAHRRGVLHRDIKPANVIVQEGGIVKLIDFGLAKLLDADGLSREDDTQGEHDDGEHGHTHGDTALTADGAILGTPYYMAPELWRGEPATARSDVYSLGVVLYELLAGHVPFHDVPSGSLAKVVQTRDAPDLGHSAADAGDQLALIVHRCLAREPAERFASGDALRDALEELDAATRTIMLPKGPPYRGLLVFEAEHRGVFFGRDTDVRRVCERPSTESLLLIAGESGVGKSSLVRAGVLPLIQEEGLGDARSWTTCTLVPGRVPLSALLAVLADRLGVEDSTLADETDRDAGGLLRRVRAFHGRSWGTVLFVDQLEELVTMSEPAQARAAAEFLVFLAERAPGVRVVATVRGDQVTEVAALPGLGESVERALYILRPLDEEGTRESIVGPARVKSARFESDALVAKLMASGGHEGSLPLLQFALSQLWEQRDVKRGLLTARSLDAMGGVEGAMSQYADQVLEGLLPAGREAARHVLMRLVTTHGTRARHTEDELVGGDRNRQSALETLVKRRLVIVREVKGEAEYELAHEALISGWTQLRRWLNREEDKRVVIERLSSAAVEWKRLGSVRDSLWRGRMLREAEDIVPGDVSPLEAGFLSASRRAERRGWWLRRLVPVAVAAAIAFSYWSIKRNEELRAQRAAAQRALVTKNAVDQIVSREQGSLAEARAQRERVAALRASAFEKYGQSRKAGDEQWEAVLKGVEALEDQFVKLSVALEVAVQKYPGFPALRDLLADALYEHALLEEMLGRTDALEALKGRLIAYDSDERRIRRWSEPVPVTLTTSPKRVPLSLMQYGPGDDDPLSAADRNVAGDGQWRLRPGAYLLTYPGSEDWAPVNYPFEIRPGSGPVDRSIPLAEKSKVPRGFVYVPPGDYWFGFAGTSALELMRHWLNATPLWPRTIHASFLIAVNETTFGEYIAFLRSLSPLERRMRMPKATDQNGDDPMELLEDNGRFALRLGKGARAVPERELYEYPGRVGGPRARQDWLAFPVTGISIEDAQMYAAWLSNKRRVPGELEPVPGATLCREDQWERAARGADARTYPHGERLHPGDANLEETYERAGLMPAGQVVGRDAVGSYSVSRSPFGLYDMMGNVWEMTLPLWAKEKPVIRGGSYWQGYATAMVPNREFIRINQRDTRIGFRICAPYPD